MIEIIYMYIQFYILCIGSPDQKPVSPHSGTVILGLRTEKFSFLAPFIRTQVLRFSTVRLTRKLTTVK